MLFNSLDFAIFLPLVFLLYWFVFSKSRKSQNCFILFSSYLFYGWWDWRFLLLIFFSSIVDFLVGYKIHSINHKVKRKILLLISISLNIGLLCYFKYFNFFIESFNDAFLVFGQDFQITRIDIILPVGISFYTFQTLSYTIDIYREKLKPTTKIIEFLGFVSFFPQLVAGPIERAKDLLPQFGKKRFFNLSNGIDGMRQILYGLFKKIVIADSCAIYVNDIFANHEIYSGIILFLGGVLFAFQIYCDFSGYSDIAIGVSNLLGIQLSQNFAFPYFSRNIAEFWRRWHISLSTWFRDYLYIPLGGSRGSLLKNIRNVFIIFVISGLWHGANYTFIAWGVLHSLFFIPLLVLNKNRNHIEILAKDKIFPDFKELISVLITFNFVVLGWILFRSEDILVAKTFYINIFSDIFSVNSYHEALIFIYYQIGYPFIIIIICFIALEYLGRRFQYGFGIIQSISNPVIRKLIYTLIMAIILSFSHQESPFIYFQF